MNEYIMEIPDYPAKVIKDGWNVRIEWEYKQREKIVRCKDCKHYEYWEFRDGRTAYDCARGGDYLFDTEPDGFCAWGERRE